MDSSFPGVSIPVSFHQWLRLWNPSMSHICGVWLPSIFAFNPRSLGTILSWVVWLCSELRQVQGLLRKHLSRGCPCAEKGRLQWYILGIPSEILVHHSFSRFNGKSFNTISSHHPTSAYPMSLGFWKGRPARHVSAAIPSEKVIDFFLPCEDAHHHTHFLNWNVLWFPWVPGGFTDSVSHLWNSGRYPWLGIRHSSKWLLWTGKITFLYCNHIIPVGWGYQDPGYLNNTKPEGQEPAGWGELDLTAFHSFGQEIEQLALMVSQREMHPELGWILAWM